MVSDSCYSGSLVSGERIRGVATNLQFVENVINHPEFAAGTVTTRFIDTTPELVRFTKRRDRATRILRYIHPQFVHVFVDGRIVESGGPELADELEENGYERFSRTATQAPA